MSTPPPCAQDKGFADREREALIARLHSHTGAILSGLQPSAPDGHPIELLSALPSWESSPLDSPRASPRGTLPGSPREPPGPAPESSKDATAYHSPDRPLEEGVAPVAEASRPADGQAAKGSYRKTSRSNATPGGVSLETPASNAEAKQWPLASPEPSRVRGLNKVLLSRSPSKPPHPTRSSPAGPRRASEPAGASLAFHASGSPRQLPTARQLDLDPPHRALQKRPHADATPPHRPQGSDPGSNLRHPPSGNDGAPAAICDRQSSRASPRSPRETAQGSQATPAVRTAMGGTGAAAKFSSRDSASPPSPQTRTPRRSRGPRSSEQASQGSQGWLRSVAAGSPARSAGGSSVTHSPALHHRTPRSPEEPQPVAAGASRWLRAVAASSPGRSPVLAATPSRRHTRN